jgi:bifunctional DNase/RNase
VRTDVPIYVEQHVLDQAGVPLDEEESVASDEPAAPEEPEKEPNEEGLTLFRDFINTLDLDEDEGQKNKQ